VKSQFKVEYPLQATRLIAIEIQAISGLRRLEGPTMTTFMTMLTRLGDAKSWIMISLSLAFFQGSLMSSGIGIGLAALTGAVTAKIVKQGIRRQRPCLYVKGPQTLVEIPDPYSFPSGHTTTAFAVFGLLMTLGIPGAVGWLVFAIGIGISRVYLGKTVCNFLPVNK